MTNPLDVPARIRFDSLVIRESEIVAASVENNFLGLEWVKKYAIYTQVRKFIVTTPLVYKSADDPAKYKIADVVTVDALAENTLIRDSENGTMRTLEDYMKRV